jgi:FkbM family methyltransferase
MYMNKVSWIFSKITSISKMPRYVRELPKYLKGTAKATTYWGGSIKVPFPEFRSVVEKGRLDANNEFETSEYFMKTITNKDVFFDVGANAGFYSLLAAHKGAEVHAFEAFPSTFKLLESNAKGKNIKCYPSAVADKSGYLYMEKMERPGLNKISEHGTVRVPAITLDELQAVPTIMKIDVEGSEMQVFEGARQMITKYKPIIVAESSLEAANFLMSLGYAKAVIGNSVDGNCLFLP